jgi:hypothetical protein
MTTITFDTLKFVERLKSAGISDEQAKAFSEAFKEAQGEADIASTRDLLEMKLQLESRFERVDGELKLNRWMLGVILAGVLSLVLKSFFP